VRPRRQLGSGHGRRQLVQVALRSAKHWRDLALQADNVYPVLLLLASQAAAQSGSDTAQPASREAHTLSAGGLA